MAHFVLGEPYGLLDAVASVISLGGVVLVSQPDFIFGAEVDIDPHDSHHFYHRTVGSLCCLLSAFIGSWAIVSVRKVGKGCHYLVFVFYFGFTLTLIGLAGMALYNHVYLPTTTLEWTSLVVIGVVSFMGQALLNAGLQNAPAGPATLMRNIDVICAFIYGITIFDEIPNALSIFGALIVLGSLFSLGVMKSRRL
jgi:drug/metabolite transporter (DMT)-like permease